MNDKHLGVYRKFEICRTDGSSAPGRKHHQCNYFVLDLNHDEFALPALKAYAEACRREFPALAKDIGEILAARPCGCRSAGECFHRPGDASGMMGYKLMLDDVRKRLPPFGNTPSADQKRAAAMRDLLIDMAMLLKECDRRSAEGFVREFLAEPPKEAKC